LRGYIAIRSYSLFWYDSGMIGYLSGTVLLIEQNHVILNVSGVGYKVYVTGDTLLTLSTVPVEFWIHTAIRENSHDLYGFRTRDDLKVFEQLITVSGIGPKTALGVLSLATPETLRQAVANENVGHLVKISGIGKRIAEKIVLELRGKLGSAQETNSELRDEGDAIEALNALGYSQKEARDALKEISKDVVGTSERVKQALKQLGKHS